ncbi:MAG: GAF domain-containing protein [Chloroflexi bacterium]|nr:GAF domain-containing protein [Chloroflexota bacterium]
MALAKVQQRAPELIVLAAELPGPVSWQAFVRRLREAGLRAPIILLSRTAEVRAQEAAGLGVRDHLRKPLMAATLRGALHAALADLRARRPLSLPVEAPPTPGPAAPAAAPSRAGAPAPAPPARGYARISDFTVLYALGRSVNSRTDIEEILHRVVEAAVLLTGAEQGSLMLLDERSGELYMRASKNFDEQFVRTFRLRTDDTLAGQVLRTGKPLMLGGETDTQIKTRFLVRAAIYVPILVRGEAIGVLSVDNQHSLASFTPRHQHHLWAVADYAAVAVDNARLYQSLRDRAAALEIALDDLSELDQLKDSMIQNLSHELRTPLIFIRGFTEMALAGSMEPVSGEISDGLRTVSRKVDQLVSILDNMHTLDPQEPLAVTLAPVTAQAIVTPVVAEFWERARHSQVVIVPDLSENALPVLADVPGVQMILRNLIDNALKFSPDGGVVTISAHPRSDQTVQVVVSDTGLGIPTDKLGRVFERFYQVDGSTTRRFGGVGLGLAAARQIVRAHGSDLKVESQPGQGSVFSFVLQRPPPA